MATTMATTSVGESLETTDGLSSAGRAIVRAFQVTVSLYAITTLTSMAGMEIFGWLSGVLALAFLVIERKFAIPKLRHSFFPADWALLGLFLTVLAGALIKVPEGISRVDVVGSVRWILLFVLLRIGLVFAWSEAFAKKLLLVMTGLLGVICIYSVWQYFNGVDLIRGAKHVLPVYGYTHGRAFFRAEGMFGTPMTFAHSLALSWSVVAAIYLRRAESGWHHWIMRIVAVLGLLALQATMTRGVWVAAAVSLAFLAIRARPRGLVFWAVAALLSVGLMKLAFPEMVDRLSSITDKSTSSRVQRFQLWQANFEMFKENPILGVGYSVNEDIIGEYYQKMGIQDGFKGHAHNTFLQFLSGTGILGFSFFAFFALYFLYLNWKAIQREQGAGGDTWRLALFEGIFAAQIALYVGGMTECNFKDAEVNHQFMLLLAVLATVYVVPAKRASISGRAG